MASGAPVVAAERAPLRALQGKNKAQTRIEFGEEQFMLRRRSYDLPPPPIADDDPLSQLTDPRYARLPGELILSRSVSRTSSSGCCRTGMTRSCLTRPPAARCWSQRPATRCAQWSSTWTESATMTSQRSTCRPASRWCRRRVPCDRAGRRYLDPEAAAGSAQAGGEAGAMRWNAVGVQDPNRTR